MKNVVVVRSMELELSTLKGSKKAFPWDASRCSSHTNNYGGV